MTQRISVGHPIDVVTGVLFHEMTDRVLLGRVRVPFSRRYSTAMRPEAGGMLGPGWSSPYEMRIRRDLDGYRMLSRDGESTVTFADDQDQLSRGQALRNLGAYMELRRQNGHLQVTSWTPDGRSVVCYHFRDLTDGPWAPLVSVQDVSGQGVDVVHDVRGRIVALQERRSRRSFFLAYNATGQLTALHADAARSRAPLIRYCYDPVGRLSEVVDAAGHVSAYAYDAAGRMVREVTRTGAVWNFEFDPQGRCTRARGQDGFDEKSLEYVPASRTTRVTDSRGSTWTYQYSAAGQVERSVSPLGRVWFIQYDDLGRTAMSCDPDGTARTFEYDELGHYKTVTTPQGTSHYDFNAHHQLIRFTDTLGSTWQREYSPEARLTAIINPLRHRWTFTWDERGDLTRLDYPDGGQRRFMHAANGDLHSESNSTGGTWTYTHGPMGELLDSRNPLGGITQREYDARGLLVSIVRPYGERTRLEYDAGGRLLRSVRPDGSTLVFRRSGCSGRLTQFSEGAYALRYQWTQEPSLLAEVISATGERHRFEYDEDNFLVSEVTADAREIRYTYDAGGNLIQRTEAGETVSYSHGPLGLPTRVTYADGSKVDITHDAAGRLIRVVDGALELSYVRDACGHPVVERSNDSVVEREFDAVGRVVRRKTGLGHETQYTYDGDGKLVSMVVGGQILRFERDALGRETRRLLPGGAQILKSYDARHRLASTEVRIPGQTTPTVDRQCRYDAQGQLTLVADRRWDASEYTYDAAGWLSSYTDALGREHYVRNASGHLVRVESDDAAWPHRTAQTAVAQTDVRRLGPGGRLLAQEGCAYVYDARGRIIQMLDQRSPGTAGVWRYAWDIRGRLESLTRPDGVVWRYTYDPFNRRLSKEGPEGRTAFHWDGDALVHAQEHAVLTTWDHHPHRQELISQHGKGPTLFAVTDHLGAPRELVTGEGMVGWAVQLAPFGDPRQERAVLDRCALRYPGQWADEESGLSYNRYRYYAPWTSQYLSPDPLGLFDDPNGAYGYSTNPLRAIDPLGLINVEYDPYDHELERPGSVYAEIFPADIGTGTQATYTPKKGYNSGHPDHHERSHMIARLLGGNGSDRRNIVILTSGTNHPVMFQHELAVWRHINETQRSVVVLVTPHYDGDSNFPRGLTYLAQDAVTGETIVELSIINGIHKNYTACTH
ncbi:RHS repeat-associated core domain-containing protein [Melittangium boletus]|uniref:RHS repeat-associated core domain-containing protein n=1 Tax=Melittangium boletus TaxID=83453 RepID=UPI003DA2A50D